MNISDDPIHNLTLEEQEDIWRRFHEPSERVYLTAKMHMQAVDIQVMYGERARTTEGDLWDDLRLKLRRIMREIAEEARS